MSNHEGFTRTKGEYFGSVARINPAMKVLADDPEMVLFLYLVNRKTALVW